MIISAIAAMGLGNEIGLNNALLWHLPEDLALFKRMTMGHCVLMGRKTFDSVGKPLPGRFNIILSRHPSSTPPKNSAVLSDLNAGIELARSRGETELFICGGAEIYAHAIGICDRLYLTIVQARFPSADTFFPRVSPTEWTCAKEVPSLDSNPNFVFQELHRIANCHS